MKELNVGPARDAAPPFFNRLRFYFSLISTFFLNLATLGVKARYLCSPGFTCHGCSLSTFACPVGVLSFSSALRSLPVFALGTISFIGIISGRLVCAFVFPFGLLQELLYRLPGRKKLLPRIFNYFKYAALLVLVFILPFILGYETAVRLNVYFCKICPVGNLTAFLPAYFFSFVNSLDSWSSSLYLRFSILILFLILMVFISCVFCRSVCPLGAIYGLLSRFSFYRIFVDPASCISCGLFSNVCPVGLHVEKEAGSAECIACGECLRICPHQAIQNKWGR
ncbi:MAG: 4Fe-4S binding protein [Candidatus Aureabacteria bacterium]|nr:4Fe-4S binding protein [Candidatus Auribacterota bacterium]